MSTSRSRPISVTTPSLGVRQWRDDSSPDITIAWATTGSRGEPRHVLLVPVHPVADGAVSEMARPKWALPQPLVDSLAFWHRPDGSPLQQDAAEPRETVAHRRSAGDAGDPATTQSITIRPDDKHWDADHIVVVLVFPELAAIGNEGGVGSDSSEGNGPAYRAAVFRELAHFFGDRYDDRLVRRGIVRLMAPALGERAVFALASCQYPADMIDGAPNDHRGPDAPASASLLQLSRILTPLRPASPSLLILAGDQVYVDATAGLFDPRARDDRLRLPYQGLLGSPGAQAVFGLLPAAMILDDHELADNWEPGAKVLPSDRTSQRASDSIHAIAAGKDAYRRFQRTAGPPLRPDGALWCTFTHHEVPFFLADTRTERGIPSGEPRRVDNWRDARIMSDDQWGALKDFLGTHKKRVSFVVSPSMLLPRGLGLGRQPSLALEYDTWSGFPSSMNDLLAF